MYIVIGSGPSGIAATFALLGKGLPVTMLDVGDKIEENPTLSKSGLEWQNKNFPLKSVFGSEFAYSKTALSFFEQIGTQCLVSHAQGGLSNVWGASVMHYSNEDLTNWPLTTKDLEPHYNAISKLDGFYINESELSCQADWVLSNLNKNKSKFKKTGINFHKSKLVLNKNTCVKCSLCLTGCTYHSIYNSSHSLEIFMKNPNFKYIPRVEVLHIEENQESVIIHAKDLNSHKEVTHTGTNVFLATGVLATLKIIFESWKKQESALPELEVAYHPYIFIPLLMFKNFKNIVSEKLHALSQLNLEIKDRRISKNQIHLQLYTYNPLIRDELVNLLKKLLLIPSFIKNFIESIFLGRLVFIQGYLNSNEGKKIKVEPFIKDDKVYFKLTGNITNSTKSVFRKLKTKLLLQSLDLGFIPLLFKSKIGHPGDGNHIGCTFPMSKDPSKVQTDLLGRIHPFRRTHIVDASVFPDIPATTITFTAMANAHRIVSETVISRTSK